LQADRRAETAAGDPFDELLGVGLATRREDRPDQGDGLAIAEHPEHALERHAGHDDQVPPQAGLQVSRHESSPLRRKNWGARSLAEDGLSRDAKSWSR
jgi:hypothetical protein